MTKWQLEKRLRHRHPPLTDEEFVSCFGESQIRQSIAMQIRNLLAKQTILDMHLLHPDDDLIETKVFAFDSLSSESFVIEMEKRFGCKIADNEFGMCRTMRQIVDYVESRIAGTKEFEDSHPIFIPPR
jgi:acyl carrier protein